MNLVYIEWDSAQASYGEVHRVTQWDVAVEIEQG